MQHRIAILVETSHGSGRDLVAGVGGYIRESGCEWMVDHETQRLEGGPPSWLARWQGDGVIARVHSQRVADALVKLGVPVIDVLDALPPGAGFETAHVDDAAISKLAFDHLAGLGLKSFAYIGPSARHWAAKRRDGFVAAARGAPNLITGTNTFTFGLGGNANTSTAGVKSGTVTLGFTSTGTTSTGATGLTPLSLAPQLVAVTGTVWNPAQASSISGTYTLGTFLVNSTGTQVLSIQNTASNTGFSERLNGSFGTLSGVTTNSGSFSLLGAGSTSTALAVYLSSGTAGSALGSAQVNFQTDGEGTSGLSAENLTSQTVSLSATFLDRAVASFTSGSTTPAILLDFNTVNVNSVVSPLSFSLYNLVQTAGFTADLALYDIDTSLATNPQITTTATSTFSNLLAGGSPYTYTASLSTLTTGTFTNTYTFKFKSANNGSVYSADTPQSLTLMVTGVIVVPEPEAIALAGIGIAAAAWAARRRK